MRNRSTVRQHYIATITYSYIPVILETRTYLSFFILVVVFFISEEKLRFESKRRMDKT